MKQTSSQATSEKHKHVLVDRELFGRLVIATKSRDVNPKEVLAYKLSDEPYLIAYPDGSLRKTRCKYPRQTKLASLLQPK